MSVSKNSDTTLSAVKYRSCFNTNKESRKDKNAIGKFSLIRNGPNTTETDSISTLRSTMSTNSLSNEDTSLSPVSSEHLLTDIEDFFSTETDDEESNQEKKKKQLNLKELNGYVGFANLPNQIYWKAVKKGFEFTLMVVGQSGLGKSTLINSIFLTDIYNSSDYSGPTQRINRTTSVETTRVMLKESGVNLLLTLVDTPGFGDAVNNNNCWTPIIKFIENKYEDYFKSETKVNRQTTTDQRVHCCLYFIQSTGHNLKPLDVEFMKHLCEKVNIIPVVAKADTLTAEECIAFKQRTLQEIAKQNIKIYEFPEISDEDEDYELNKSLKGRVPFAVAGSNTVVEVGGKKVRGREYPWGFVDIENLEHCDFGALRKMIICMHLQDLKDVTHNVHYENYRLRRLCSTSASDQKHAEERLENVNQKSRDSEMKELEDNIKQKLLLKVCENLQKLEEREAELREHYEAAKEALAQQAKELEECRWQFELEKEAWEKEHRIHISKPFNSGEPNEDQKKTKKKRFF